ncbi:hypothetical protein DQ384_25620 [Sphaerisporangium album]|uniref:Uncharacterized protein n=1 Tax=Sphaerisporangium album TaxID=509200 RepID=A0A367FDI2_9ACTN|nr:hypothetical protein DQ384_25620 [Sphaerisporangium album]
MAASAFPLGLRGRAGRLLASAAAPAAGLWRLVPGVSDRGVSVLAHFVMRLVIVPALGAMIG